MGRLVLGTRGSALALWQARAVAARLRERHPELEVDERVIKTAGDRTVDVGIEAVGGEGVFVRQLQQALSDGEIDLAVHSLKDLPSATPAGLSLGAVLERHDPRDALLTVSGQAFADLPRGARLGTGSPRRRAQLLHARPDLEILPIRGNVDTRVAKLIDGDYDAIVLALAAVQRLQIDSVRVDPLDVTLCVPAVGQGVIAVEIREGDDRTRDLVDPLEHEVTRVEIETERAFLRSIGAGCQAPAACYARLETHRLVVEAVVGDSDGRVLVLDREVSPAAEAIEIGERLASRLLVAGAARLLERTRQQAT